MKHGVDHDEEDTDQPPQMTMQIRASIIQPGHVQSGSVSKTMATPHSIINKNNNSNNNNNNNTNLHQYRPSNEKLPSKKERKRRGYSMQHDEMPIPAPMFRTPSNKSNKSPRSLRVTSDDDGYKEPVFGSLVMPEFSDPANLKCETACGCFQCAIDPSGATYWSALCNQQWACCFSHLGLQCCLWNNPHQSCYRTTTYEACCDIIDLDYICCKFQSKNICMFCCERTGEVAIRKPTTCCKNMMKCFFVDCRCGLTPSSDPDINYACALCGVFFCGERPPQLHPTSTSKSARTVAEEGNPIEGF
eukprot:CAMPEP_0167783620 /NCGR_PEP_ID=MMETSP0111_2-20121227/7171_1 /TAXON_ID=91324 /ORGANISM="Lotharella globosa, Strain CCCM811" /LENGTH=302 /DNA_ID=CAMNT_0007674577 /DNA_START=111 /DNA_END=1019 /DNA_ORIENTATION=+